MNRRALKLVKTANRLLHYDTLYIGGGNAAHLRTSSRTMSASPPTMLGSRAAPPMGRSGLALGAGARCEAIASAAPRDGGKRLKYGGQQRSAAAPSDGRQTSTG